MTKRNRLGDLQHAIMRQLWDRGEATVNEVHQALHPERGLALTTIATMLRKMGDRGLVTHRTEGRQYVYRACVNETEVNRSMVGELIDRLFDGQPSELVNHLVRERDIDAQELKRMRALIEDAAGTQAGEGGDA
ncbi:MAG: BlaI/MecI/CopY family transcriptional regulator [Planctomycetota bacterium]